MSTVKVDAGGFAGAMERIVGSYGDEVRRALSEDVRAAGRDCAQALRKTSPRRTGRYAKGWRADERTEGDGSTTVVVHNSAKPSLTHLLEHGHGGPHPAGAHPHIEAAANAAFADMERRLSQ